MLSSQPADFGPPSAPPLASLRELSLPMHTRRRSAVGEAFGRGRGKKSRTEGIVPSSISPIEHSTRLFTLKQRLEETPPWLISTILHLLLLLTLALISTSSGEIGNILLTIRQAGDQATSELVEFTIAPSELDELPTEDPWGTDSWETDPWETEVNVDIEPLEAVKALDLVSVSVTSEFVVAPFASPSAKKLPSTNAASMFRGRTGAMKQRLLKAAGGTQATEDAVSLGLEWLKRQQLQDGRWSLMGPYTDGAQSENNVSATAMAMLAFMGAGSTHRSGQYKKELWQSVRWLVKQQDRQGFMAAQAGDHEKMYAQAQAMIALCELYAMTGDSWIRPYAQASCDFACRAQSPEGGWRYRPRFDSDTSVTGWFVMGLKSGEAAGLKVDRYIWPKVAKYLDSVSAKPENDYYSAVGYSYKVGDVATPSMTAEGLLCRQYMGLPRNTLGMRQGLGALADNHPIDYREPNVYYWYYATQSLHHFGGPLWTKWNDKLKVELPAKQEMRGRERGSWSPQHDAWGRHAGRLYTTCFSLYCLEVYYRHMPLYDPNEET
ncbi:hypothetical protein Q31b_51700 [Novipirellula aureliae]|uniref:Squalene cyclase C-terminal domain-containing protein n=1 Tax=Novipirellula aureliae TaxID=2527966 RepID=A0A5C6DHR8_9BACT|nr:prenyltransferase/squalene oxidase repeat-containing protein [Novipirellula aureliae]TWU35735.1 hypothetical protein Q31b_51700 [Novipirellula aureliae]